MPSDFSTLWTLNFELMALALICTRVSSSWVAGQKISAGLSLGSHLRVRWWLRCLRPLFLARPFWCLATAAVSLDSTVLSLTLGGREMDASDLRRQNKPLVSNSYHVQKCRNDRYFKRTFGQGHHFWFPHKRLSFSRHFLFRCCFLCWFFFSLPKNLEVSGSWLKWCVNGKYLFTVHASMPQKPWPSI